uniref:Uncharacterized protein n=1 Tax=Phlebotomus papatasi TaxID=29031 RepID=A0A1B0DJH9_PHLPP
MCQCGVSYSDTAYCCFLSSVTSKGCSPWIYGGFENFILTRSPVRAPASRNDMIVVNPKHPHSTTGKTPTQLFFERTIRGKIPSLADVETAPPNTDFADRDRILKEKGKESEDRKRRAGVGDITVRSKVVLKNVLPGNKFSPVFDSKIYEVLEKSGARFKLQEVLTERTITHAKKVYTTFEEDSDTPSEPPLQIENMIQSRAKTSSSSDFSRLSDNLTTPTSHEGDADVFDSSKSQELQDASVVTLRPHRPARRPVKYQDYVL